MLLTISGCSLISDKSDGSDLASQSCSTDLLPASATSKIVAIGLEKSTPDKILRSNLASRIDSDQQRSILSAQAAAINTYWQPLADAWALEEALARATLVSKNETYFVGTEVKINNTHYEKFLSNINIDFAAVAKDTYCRIAFVKQKIAIGYEK